MIRLLRLVFWLFFVSPFLLLAAAWLLLSNQPLLQEHSVLSPQDIAAAQIILKKNDPRAFQIGSEHEIIMNESDARLASQFLLSTLADSNASQVEISQDSLQASSTLYYSKIPFKPYLNIQISIANIKNEIEFTHLTIGQVALPPVFAQLIFNQFLREFHKTQQYQLTSNSIQKVELRKNEIRLRYFWNPKIIEDVKKVLQIGGSNEALKAYNVKAIQLQSQNIGTNGSLISLLEPLFKHAAERSIKHDPISENKSLLLFLGAWASNQGLTVLIPNAESYPKQFLMKLEGRTDLAQHFLTSAALGANGHQRLANTAGIYKELKDSHGVSGFSFADITANQAGARFGKLATSHTKSAIYVQQHLMKKTLETDLMPKVLGLPEHLNSTQFKQQYKEVGSPPYEKIMQKIDWRISNCAIFKNALDGKLPL